MIRARINAAWCILIFNILDLILTYVVINGYQGEEGNPLATFLITSYLALPLKIGLSGFVLWSAYKFKDKTNITTVCAGWFVAGIYAMVVLFNIATLIGKLHGM